MISFRLSVIALSVTLIFSIGSSASIATTNYSHPEFSAVEDRTLNLRETSSQIVIQTIENALRQGGLALLGEGFQLDSSLSYHSGDNEGIEGDLDVVIPLWNGSRHAVFAQPGAVFWTGLAEEERVDGNIGLVYRAELTRDLVAGASVFYDHDFQIGHTRVSGGIDLQSRFFRLGANYYHPLSEIEDGREGFVEEALLGGDLHLVFEREVVRLGGTVGYWEYDGGEDVEDDWKTSVGLDAGVRILPGVFAEARWERHKDDIVLDERIFAGLAFRFSLPDFEGASYGDGSMSANLYKIVDREKRILYEERVAGPRVSFALPDGVSANVEEDDGNPVSVEIRLSEPLEENVAINLVGGGSATYGEDEDWKISIGGTDCTGVMEEDNCRVEIAAGQTGASVMVTINEDGGGEGSETIILSMVIASAGDTDLMARGSLVLTIPADPPLPTVSLSADSTSVREGGTATLTLTLSEDLRGNATFNLIGSSTEATYGASDDWNLDVGGTDCDMASEGNPCQVTISQGATSAEVTVEVNANSPAELPEDFTVSVVVDSVSRTLVAPGRSSSLDFTIEGAPTVSLNYSGSTTLDELATAPQYSITIELSEVLTEDVRVNIRGEGSATYRLQGVGDYGLTNGASDCPGDTGSQCQATISAGQTTLDFVLSVPDDFQIETTENVTISIFIDAVSRDIVALGSNSSVRFDILDAG